MLAEQGWEAFRAYLKELLQDANVKKQIEQRTDISARTLARWVSGETEEPDRKRLSSLLQALPQYREPLLEAINKAIPEFSAPLIDTTSSILEDLPLDFWIRLLETNANIPQNLHFSSIVNLIFLQLQATIDPDRLGVELIVEQCSPPASHDQPVRSLRQVMKMKTHQSLLKNPGEYSFLGAESLSGYSVGLCQANIVQNIEEEQAVPVRRTQDAVIDERSAAAYPIQRVGRVAGCFLVTSPRPYFFTPRLQQLLQIYSYLLSMAFESDMFYPPERIRLRPMPEESIQHQYIAEFQNRVLKLLQQDTSLSRPQAEAQVWQEIEDALLAGPFEPNTEGDAQHAGTD
jgi:transcriptional regulator with XRE-family HTH domain